MVLPSEGQERIPPSLQESLQWVKTLSRGLGGNVDLCHHRALDCPVVLKWAVGDEGADDELNARFLRESRALCRISHPRVVRVLDSGLHGGVQFLLFEHVEGPNLEQVLDKRPMMPWWEALQLAHDLAEGLAEAHRLEILHRDLKPANTIMHPSRGPVLIDFGLVKTAADSFSLTPRNVALGTPAYVSPESILGDPIGPPADIYALGVMLYQMLVGFVPFSRGPVTAVLESHVNDPPPPIPDLPHDLDQLLQRCLAKSAIDRPRDAGQFVEEARRVLGNAPSSLTISTGGLARSLVAEPPPPVQDPPPPAKDPPRPAPKSRPPVPLPRRRPPTAALAAAGIVAGVVTGFLLLRPASAPRPLPGPAPAPASTVPGVERTSIPALIFELTRLIDRTEFGFTASQLSRGMLEAPRMRSFLDQVTSWCRDHRDELIHALEDPAAPLAQRWTLHHELSALESLERVFPTGHAPGWDIAGIRNAFIVTKVIDSATPPAPGDREEVLARFDPRRNLLVIPGLDKEATELALQAMVGEPREIQVSLAFELPWEGGTRARRIRIATRCQQAGRSLELALGDDQALVVCGRGSPSGSVALVNIAGAPTGRDRSVQHQVIEIALPGAALPAGRHRVTLHALQLLVASGGSIDCLPAIDWVAISR